MKVKLTFILGMLQYDNYRKNIIVQIYLNRFQLSSVLKAID